MKDEDLLAPIRRPTRNRRPKTRERIIVGQLSYDATEEERKAHNNLYRARQRQRMAEKREAKKRQRQLVARQLDGRRKPLTDETKAKLALNLGRPPLPKALRRTQIIPVRVTAFQKSVIEARMSRAGALQRRRAGVWLREVALGYESAWPVVDDAAELPEKWSTRQADVMEYREGVIVRALVTKKEKHELKARARAAGYSAVGAYLRDLWLGRDRETTTSTEPLGRDRQRRHKHVIEANFEPRTGKRTKYR
tara:strand:+ start:681 stop:1433 length:753 start_codon:yes stop_codon:yes gene_type:complete